MLVLRVAAWVGFGLAGAGLVLMMAYSDPLYLGAAISLAAGGVVLLALDRIIAHLATIEDLLRGQPAEQEAMPTGSASPSLLRSLDALDADLKRLRGQA
jgi:hypothetical protein